MTVGLELTFLPVAMRPWPEWRDQAQAIAVKDRFATALVKALNKDLDDRDDLVIKADVFRHAYGDISAAWCIEVNGRFDAWALMDSLSRESRVIAAVYRVAKRLGLRARVTRRQGDTLVEFPTGGGHLMLAMHLFSSGGACLSRLAAWERAVCADYVNHPFIRFAFGQWLDDNNHQTAVHRDEAGTKLTPEGMVEVTMCTGITQAFARSGTGKGHYPTWEFRFFDAPDTAADLRLQVQFLRAWARYHVSEVCAGTSKPRYTLTRAYYDRLVKDTRFARAEMAAFWRRIGLDFKDYVPLCYDAHYLPRVRFGVT